MDCSEGVREGKDDSDGRRPTLLELRFVPLVAGRVVEALAMTVDRSQSTCGSVESRESVAVNGSRNANTAGVVVADSVRMRQGPPPKEVKGSSLVGWTKHVDRRVHGCMSRSYTHTHMAQLEM
jgi:hypothetical protein